MDHPVWSAFLGIVLSFGIAGVLLLPLALDAYLGIPCPKCKGRHHGYVCPPKDGE